MKTGRCMDGFITILTILILIVPAVAKVIEKTLVQAGKSDAAGKVRRFMEQTGDGGDGEPARTGAGPVLDEPFPSVVFVPETEGHVTDCRDAGAKPAGTVPQELLEDGYRSIKDIVADRRKRQEPVSVSVQPAGEDRKIRIDPEKLILYSEIMKTKF